MMLNLLRGNIFHVTIQDLEFLFPDIETMVIDVGLMVYSLQEGEEAKEDMALGVANPAPVLDLSGNLQHIRTTIYLTIRKVFQSNLPRIHGLGYVDFLLNNLREFQSRYSNSLAFVMNQIQMIQKELERAQPFLEDVAKERHNKHGGLQYCATLLIGKAYEVEYVVDACIRKDVPHWFLESLLLDIIEEITRIRAEVGELQGKKMFNPVSHDTMKTATDHKQGGGNCWS